MMFHGFYNLDHVGDIALTRVGDGKTFSLSLIHIFFMI